MFILLFDTHILYFRYAIFSLYMYIHKKNQYKNQEYNNCRFNYLYYDSLRRNIRGNKSSRENNFCVIVLSLGRPMGIPICSSLYSLNFVPLGTLRRILARISHSSSSFSSPTECDSNCLVESLVKSRVAY